MSMFRSEVASGCAYTKPRSPRLSSLFEEGSAPQTALVASNGLRMLVSAWMQNWMGSF